MAPEEPIPSVDDLVAQLKAKVEERRRRGEYPADLEDRLSEHFRRIAAMRPPGFDPVPMQQRLALIEKSFQFDAGKVNAASRLPGGSILHKTVAKMVRRQTDEIFEQVRYFAAVTRDTFSLMFDMLQESGTHVHRDVQANIDALYEKLSVLDRSPQGGDESVVDLRRRIERLEAARDGEAFDPWYDLEHWEASFRRPREELLDQYRDLAAQLQGCGPVLDIGCGRGEFLELLQELGVEARGVELDPDLAALCQKRGLDVIAGDGLEALGAVPDGSLGGLVMIQVVEHISAQQVVDLALTAQAKVRKGGKVILETVNPQSLYVYAHSFYLDPTHVRPVHPLYLQFLFREAGFSDVDIQWRGEVPSDDVVQPVSGDNAAVLNENARRLNELLFAAPDYALVAIN